MNLLHRLEIWGDRHHPKWLDLVRMALGIFLFIKGIQFPQQMNDLLSRLPEFSFSTFSLIILGHYILFAHLVGGLLLFLGIFTRLACVIQIPILLGAIIFINSAGGLWEPFSELYISIIVLLLLFLFLITGNGSWSVARLLTEDEKT